MDELEGDLPEGASRCHSPTKRSLPLRCFQMGSSCCESSKTLQSSLLQTPDSSVEVVAFVEEYSEPVTLPLPPVTGMSMHPLPYWRKMMSKDGDFYLLAKSYLDCREHKRAAHVLRYCHC
ncbi:hypothetical protein NC652_026909 [Populus alba x Populus x berolinensis]|nr:hypothetical protein NC652_026909 [Populus alba x Populus x berolinensis]